MSGRLPPSGRLFLRQRISSARSACSAIQTMHLVRKSAAAPYGSSPCAAYFVSQCRCCCHRILAAICLAPYGPGLRCCSILSTIMGKELHSSRMGKGPGGPSLKFSPGWTCLRILLGVLELLGKGPLDLYFPDSSGLEDF